MSILEELSPEELSLLTSAIAISLSKGRNNDELNVLGNFVSTLGSLLQMIGAQKESADSLKEKKQQIKNLKKEIGR